MTDTLEGGADLDTYIFNEGDGADTVIDGGSTTQFGGELLFNDIGNMNELEFTIDSLGNFVIEVVDSSDQVTLKSSEANGKFALQIKNNANTPIAEIVKSDSVAGNTVPVQLIGDTNIANILLGKRR